ncbi:hypothetical protein F66182_1953 [Fusarium sp. NRRL 66182]|nr:hypothetical protein F66182_1953 [Fusarium sp. NRRL 66182]
MLRMALCWTVVKLSSQAAHQTCTFPGFGFSIAVLSIPSHRQPVLAIRNMIRIAVPLWPQPLERVWPLPDSFTHIYCRYNISGLDVKYDHRFGSVLRTKYADRAQALLDELKRWGVFICGGAGRRVYHWDTTIIQKHFNSEHDVKRWIESHRQQARAAHKTRTPHHTPRVSWVEDASTSSPLRRSYRPSPIALPDHRGPMTPTAPRSLNMDSPLLASPATPTSPTLQVQFSWWMIG